MVAGRTAGSAKLSNAQKTSSSSCVCHAPSQLPRALQPGADVCPTPKITLRFPFLLVRGRTLDPAAKDIQSGNGPTPESAKLGLIKRKILDDYRAKSDEALLGELMQVLKLCAGDEGARAVVWFAKANGAKYTHGPDSTLSKMAQETRQFVTSYHTLLIRVREAVSKLAAGGKVPDFATLHARVEVPVTHWGLLDLPTGTGKVADNETALKAIFGGTQGEEIWVTALKHDRLKRAYALRLRWHIFDHFGADESDLYAPGLVPLYVLQHERQGYRAYVNELVVERWMAGSY